MLHAEYKVMLTNLRKFIKPLNCFFLHDTFGHLTFLGQMTGRIMKVKLN